LTFRMKPNISKVFLYPIVASKISYARAPNNRYNLGGDGDGGNGR